MRKTVQKGFTLIELMIVVAIVGILAAVALPAYQDYTIRAQITESLSLIEGLKNNISDYYAQTGDFPVDKAHAVCGDSGTTGCTGFKATDTQGNYVVSVDVVKGGGLDVTFGNKANVAIATKILSIRAALDSAKNISWVCGKAAKPGTVSAPGATDSTNVDLKFLPTSCKI